MRFKAVFITKESQAKRKQALLRGKKATYEELSNYLGISTFNLEKMINDGYSPDEIEKKIKKGVKKEEQLKFNEDSLYSYCIKNSYNYWVINYMIKTFNKTPSMPYPNIISFLNLDNASIQTKLRPEKSSN